MPPRYSLHICSVGGAGARILAAEGGGGQGDGSIPISSIEFDYPPPAPPSPPPAQLAGRASSVGVGNLYENMAKQMAAFLAGAGAGAGQESREPKMVVEQVARLANTTGRVVNLVAGGGAQLLDLDTLLTNSLVQSPSPPLQASGWEPLVEVEGEPHTDTGAKLVTVPQAEKMQAAASRSWNPSKLENSYREE